MLNLSTNSVRYKCHKCGSVSEWERTEDGWRVKPEPERSWEQ
jgi:transposase-like protein